MSKKTVVTNWVFALLAALATAALIYRSAVAATAAATTEGLETVNQNINFYSGCPPDLFPGWADKVDQCCAPNHNCRAPLRAGEPVKLPSQTPTVFVGGAYARAMDDMRTKPHEWEQVRRQAGFYMHPMGYIPWIQSRDDKGRGAEFQKHFTHKTFVIEESIGAAYSPTRHALDHYYNMARHGEPGWTCAGYFLYVENEKIYEQGLEAVIKKYYDFTRPLITMGIPVYLFFTPLNVKDPRVKPLFDRKYKGKRMWIYFAKKVGASGVALDFPHGYWLDRKAEWGPAWYKKLAISVAKTSQAEGLKFAWCLDGKSHGPMSDVKKFMKELMDDENIFPDLWLVDHFNDDKVPGTPETGHTVTGMALTVIEELKRRKRPLMAKTTATPPPEKTTKRQPAAAAAPPSWARSMTLPENKKPLAYAAGVVKNANASEKRVDVAMWGDSITEGWRYHFAGLREPPFGAGAPRVAVLGVPATRIEQLTWRMMTRERFARDPRCIVILIGVNNVLYEKNEERDPSKRMDYLLGWIRAAMPSSKVVLMALLPTIYGSVDPTNAKYKELARTHGAAFVDCGAGLDIRDKTQSSDGLHLTAAGYDRLLACLKPTVLRALDSAS